MKDILTLAKIQIIVIVLFVFSKWLRPDVLSTEGYVLFKLFLLSFPNLVEGIIGVLTLTVIGIYLKKYTKITYRVTYLLAITLATIYVTTQELKFHNLGGNNVYDPNDLIFSAVGILVGAFIIFRLKPKYEPE
ncbi:hypothetical protein [Kangiella sp. HZ709]|uniref:hypothetical protein n=1 Tax=Kangiella sp. HZ709 TaxID=2666328 RepID=UPI0012AF3287|nr:hypothetical protein [Kangiella sp. HZ709]MRX28169.1 hypothetical protein [Kangiella sp. HZ709]